MGTYLRILGIVVGLCGLFGTYKIYETYLHYKNLYEWNIAQIDQLKKEQREYELVISNLRLDKEELIEELKKNTEKYENGIAELKKHLKSPEILKSDRGSSQILKETIKGLRGK